MKVGSEMKMLLWMFLGFIFILGILEFFEITLTCIPFLCIMIVLVLSVGIYKTIKG